MRRSTAALLSMVVSATASATTYPVGPTRTYRSPCALVAAVTLTAGDIVEVDPGTYTDACQLTASGSASAPITLRGLAGTRPVFDASGLDLSGAGSVPRAIFQFTGGSFWVVQNLELKNASNASANGAAFRATAGSHDILIEDVSVHDCQDGMMSDGVATVTVRDSDIFHNGAGDGYSHNFYMSGQSTTLIGNHIHDSNGGQNVKLRSHDATLLYNRIENAGNYEIDLIQSPPATDQPYANAVLIGNVIVRPSSSGNNSQVILFGTDDTSALARNGTLFAVNNTFVLQNASNRLLHAILPVLGSQIVFQNNIVFATVGGTAISSDTTTTSILSGTNNWIGSNVGSVAALVNTVSGSDPRFVGAGDYHLRAASTAIDSALANPTYQDGSGVTHSAVPGEEFLAPQGTTPRPSVGSLDIGAFEFSASDAGTGVPPDAGGTGDAGSLPPDGGTGGPDGGLGAGTAVTGSCGCTQPGGVSLTGLLLAVAAGVASRRRRSPCFRAPRTPT